MKKLLSCIVACAMMISILGINAYAAEREIQSEAPMITEEVAQIIASYFLRDYQDEAGCCWDTNTAIVNSVIMYNLEEEISAYSFELATSGVESGYIVVSAYPDVENVILEFSDTATPVYEPFNLSVGEKIIYTGGLNYFKESVDGTFFAVNGKTLQKNQIETPLESIRSEKYLPASFRDYEYPIKAKYWKAFSNFLVNLDSELGGKKIGLAMSDWDIGISKEAMQCVDMVEMMEYDLFDDYGDHSSFDCAQKGIEKFINAGFDSKVLDLGIPFYGRPADKGEYWYNYGDYAKILGKYSNKAEIDGKQTYFNSYGLVYDKTSLAIDYELGGVMVFRYGSDDLNHKDISLFTAINQSINNRKN